MCIRDRRNCGLAGAGQPADRIVEVLERPIELREEACVQSRRVWRRGVAVLVDAQGAADHAVEADRGHVLRRDA